jgi:hypothetical protein
MSAVTSQPLVGLMNAPLRSATLVCLVLPCKMAYGQLSSPAENFSVERLTHVQLMDVSLACDSAATKTRLSPIGAMQCSIVSERLQQHVFGGDFDRLLAWWEAHRRAEWPGGDQ